MNDVEARGRAREPASETARGRAREPERETAPGPPDAASHAALDADELGFALPLPAAPGKRRLTLGLVALAGALLLAFLAGYLPKLQARQTLDERARAQTGSMPAVQVVRPERLAGSRNLTLPASVRPLTETTVYPRASGYVHAFHKDLGERVEQGELLAEIDTPELDQQIVQARAQLAQVTAALGQAKANSELSRVTLERYKVLKPVGVTSQQELDQRAAQAVVDESNVVAAEAAIAVQRANLARLNDLKSFARVTAPFAGRITSRSIDLGTLVTLGNASPLFQLVADDPVRVFVDVPQDVAPSVRVGRAASVLVREYPERRFTGQIAHAAGALSEATRTMRTEVRVPNHDGALLSGMYAEVSLELDTPHVVYELPATALISGPEGLRVMALGAADRVHFLPVRVERDQGATIQIASGLRGDERIVKLAGVSLSENQRVRVVR
jgi:membrane fusion protein (multidrug efflux system)